MGVHAWSVTKSCPTLCNPMDCSPPGSSAHGILQAGILEWGAISSSRESSQPRDQAQVSCAAALAGSLPLASWEAQYNGMYIIKISFKTRRASLVAQTVKNLSAMQETLVWSLGREDPLEKGMTTHSSIPAWRIPWAEEPCRLQSMGSQRVGHDWHFLFTFQKWRNKDKQKFKIACWLWKHHTVGYYLKAR